MLCSIFHSYPIATALDMIPLYWSNNPRDAAPSWINYILKLFNYQLPEHKIFYQKDAVQKLFK